MRMNRDDWLLFLSQLLNGAAFGMWRYILPIHIQDLGATPSQVGMVLASGWLVTTLTLFPAGLLADRINRKKLAILLTLTPVIPTLLLPKAETWQILMLLLLPVWLHIPNIIVINTYLTYGRPKFALGRIIAVLNFSYIVGELIMRSIGARIAEQSGFGRVFQISSVTFLLASIPLFLLKRQASGKPNTWEDYRPLFRSRKFIIISLFSMLIFFIMQTGQALVPNYAQDVIGLELSSIGDLGTLSSLGGAILSLLLGRFGFRRGLIGAQVGAAVALILLLLSPTSIGLMISFFFLGSYIATFALTDGLMGSSVPTKLSGLAFGVQGTLIGFGSTLGPIASGLLYDQAPHYPLILSIAGLCVLIPLTFLVPQPEREDLLLK